MSDNNIKYKYSYWIIPCVLLHWTDLLDQLDPQTTVQLQALLYSSGPVCFQTNGFNSLQKDSEKATKERLASNIINFS